MAKFTRRLRESYREKLPSLRYLAPILKLPEVKLPITPLLKSCSNSGYCPPVITLAKG